MNHPKPRHVINHVTRAFLLIIFLSVVAGACKKSRLSPVPSPIVGTWTWIQSGEGNLMIITPATTGVRKMLSFGNDGGFSMIHNDSVNVLYELFVYEPLTLLSTSHTTTGSYTLPDVASPCSGIKSPSLVITGQTSVGYSISNDTLYITPGSCLSPSTSIYVRFQPF